MTIDLLLCFILAIAGDDDVFAVVVSVVVKFYIAVVGDDVVLISTYALFEQVNCFFSIAVVVVLLLLLLF